VLCSAGIGCCFRARLKKRPPGIFDKTDATCATTDFTAARIGAIFAVISATFAPTAATSAATGGTNAQVGIADDVDKPAVNCN